MKFEVGEKVEHILSKDWMIVLDVQDGFVLCRTKDLRAIQFHEFELKKTK